MTEYPMLFRTTKKDIMTIKERVLEEPNLTNDYYAKYGAGWRLKLSGDVIATAVACCYLDYIETCGGKPTLDKFEEVFDGFDYWDLFDRLGLTEIRPSDGLARPIMRTYAMAILEGRE